MIVHCTAVKESTETLTFPINTINPMSHTFIAVRSHVGELKRGRPVTTATATRAGPRATSKYTHRMRRSTSRSGCHSVGNVSPLVLPEWGSRPAAAARALSAALLCYGRRFVSTPFAVHVSYPPSASVCIMMYLRRISRCDSDGMTYSFGVYYDEFLTYFGEGKGKTAWIVSILVGVTLSSDRQLNHSERDTPAVGCRGMGGLQTALNAGLDPGPISSSFVNRWGCRAVTVAGALLSAVCVTASAFAQNVLTLIFTIGVCTGFGFGLIYLPAIVSVTVWFEQYRSLATGIAVCGSGLGTFLFAPLTSALINNYGWRGSMAIMGAIVLNCVVFGLMFKPVPEPPRMPASEPMLPKAKSPLKRSQSSENVVRANGNAEDGDVARLTLSQPALNKPQEHPTRSRCGSGVMQRPDVLYQGSMTSLSKHRPPSPERALSSKYKEDPKQRCGWLPCSDDFKAVLSEMLDLSLLVNPVFLLFSLSNFLTSIGFYIPYVYTVPMLKEMGIENPEYFISIIGAANSIGRVILGYISDKPWVNRLLAYNLCLTISGVATAASTLCWEFWGLAMYATTFGFTIGAYVGLTSVVLVDLLGLEKLTNAFGLLLLFQGIASLIGPPFAGWLYDELKSYVPGFYLAGGTIALSGIILFLIPFFERRYNRSPSTPSHCSSIEELYSNRVYSASALKSNEFYDDADNFDDIDIDSDEDVCRYDGSEFHSIVNRISDDSTNNCENTRPKRYSKDCNKVMLESSL
ncbi:Monocarboxylate transporter 9 [Eumeta japonica]|uniref:Monocarboxylate transporter 9 n=1 Tax=Eumeta variegata TaxID=151549 RepID=A0A4C1UY43_EUMVA|nr:Monocarboxylate transporter 9 [Eumeta japonica]